jgi:hypothetical protein
MGALASDAGGGLMSVGRLMSPTDDCEVNMDLSAWNG